VSPLVVAVVGPTAAGKSDLGVALARVLAGDVVNADSMQLYRGMDIGTAKLTLEERQGVPHHLLDVWDVRVTATAAAYQELAREVVRTSERPLVFVGGSGLYLRAALDRLEFPGTDPELRALLEAELEEHGPVPLWERLRALDAGAATRMQPTNGRRVVRALEVVMLQGSMPGRLTAYESWVPVTYLGLDRPDLRERVAARVERMWAEGLPAEVAALDGLREGVTARQALGYKQALDQLAGLLSEEDAKAATVSATNRFVKRQRAWFRRDPRIHWLDPSRDLLSQALAHTNSGRDRPPGA
jgi:tRNA dimethylallyltransferase